MKQMLHIYLITKYTPAGNILFRNPGLSVFALLSRALKLVEGSSTRLTLPGPVFVCSDGQSLMFIRITVSNKSHINDVHITI